MHVVRVREPTFEHHPSGLGVGTSTPRISWQFEHTDTDAKDWTQSAYDVEVTRGSPGTTKVFHVKSAQSVLVEWPDVDLQPRESADIRIRCYGHNDSTGNVDTPTDWSSLATVEAALLSPELWQAQFITAAKRLSESGPCRPLVFNRSFNIPVSYGTIVKARLYITALGVFDVSINGSIANDEHMAPGWTSYHHRLAYRVLDVAALLKQTDDNNISIEVGEGWYAGRLGFLGGKRFCYGGKDLAALAQLEVTFDSGSNWSLVTDDSWTYTSSAILSSEIYDGEVYDARFRDAKTRSDQLGIEVVSWPLTTLTVTDAPPVRVTETRSPNDVFRAANGTIILDFGQNLVGKLMIKSLLLESGSKATFTHAEVLENGNIGTRPLRGAKQTDTIIGSGREINHWSPKFTFHGFRYVQVQGWPDIESIRDNITALILRTDMKRRGHFSCSNASVNKLHENTVWSMRGNFLSIPTDCPQRDERLGWTGDLQVFCPSACFLYDTTGMLAGWLKDLAAEQAEEHRKGSPPLIVPDVMPPSWPHMPQAVWNDACILTPEVLYRFSEDKEILTRQFENPSAPPEDPGNGRTDSILVADAYLVHVTSVFAEVCRSLDKIHLAESYAASATRLKKQFQNLYISPAGNIASNSQTAIALAIQFGLYENQQQISLASTNLERLIKYARFKISTGFAGTPLINHALTTLHKSQLAYRMLLERGMPSWMYPVTMGATTIWERWDSMLPDGSINLGEMTSFNHYALGAVVNWLHYSVAGISPLKPGWKVVLVKPVPGGNLSSARASFDGPYGLVSIEWTLKDGSFSMTLTIPPNSSAVIVLPSSSASEESNRQSSDEETNQIVGSGTHHFSIPLTLPEWPPKALVASYLKPSEDDIAE